MLCAGLCGCHYCRRVSGQDLAVAKDDETEFVFLFILLNEAPDAMIYYHPVIARSGHVVILANRYGRFFPLLQYFRNGFPQRPRWYPSSVCIKCVRAIVCVCVTTTLLSGCKYSRWQSYFLQHYFSFRVKDEKKKDQLGVRDKWPVISLFNIVFHIISFTTHFNFLSLKKQVGKFLELT